MAADNEHHWGWAGWLTVGFLAGVATSIAMILFVSSRVDQDQGVHAARYPQATVRLAPPPAPPLAKPKRPKPTVAAAASDRPPHAPRSLDPTAEVADDAAAAGMTSRAPPQQGGDLH